MGYVKTKDTNGWKPPGLKQIIPQGTVKISFNIESFTTSHEVSNPDVEATSSIESLIAVIVNPVGEIKTYKYITDDHFYADVSIPGEYKIIFYLIWGTHFAYHSTYAGREVLPIYGYFSVATEESLSPYTIKDVIDRTLAVTPTRRDAQTQKYTFRNNAEEYGAEESPEFTFTGKHLFEVMLDIASYKKMFPAVYKNEIYFRPFWNGVMLTSDDLPPPYKAIMNSAIDQYCTALDSYVENMVCINDTNVGTVVEPYKNGYISSRSGGGSEISESTAVIPTQSPIYQLTKLNMGKTNGVDIGNIQAYIYEQEDYEALSDTSVAYPYSKGYALKYQRFEKNITELAHRIDSKSTIAQALKQPALANIVQAKKGGTVGTNLATFINGFLGISNGNSFAGLRFQLTYIPVVNARVRQYKPLLAEGDEATLFYNQQSEVVDSEAFGEHVKGLVQKLGNHTEIRVYRFGKIDEVPTVGTLIDGKSVYDVAMTIFENHVDATVCLVDYAELSTYIGVKNEIKTSDISTTKWCNRFINWEEFFIFSKKEYLRGDAVSIKDAVLSKIVQFTSAEPITCAELEFRSDSQLINSVMSPIKHLALGNSIYFQFEMLDNFAAGYKSEVAPEGATSVLTGTKYNRAQKAVRYCDFLGRAEYVNINLSEDGPNSENSEFSLDESILNWNLESSGESLLIKCTLTQSINCPVNIVFRCFDNSYTPTEHTIKLEANQTSGSVTVGNVLEIAKVHPESIKLDNTSNLYDEYVTDIIAHSYPERPKGLVIKKEYSIFSIGRLVIKKDSAEALKFAMQYHFRQDWRDFIIGSGMSNFCSLIGGACSQLQMFVSAKPLNRFERHFSLTPEDGFKKLNGEPVFTVEEDSTRVKIDLPSTINDESYNQGWGLCGQDRNGNWQLIFGENKNAKNEAFSTTIYLIASKK